MNISYLFEYSTQNFLPKKELKVWVRVINEVWVTRLDVLGLSREKWKIFYTIFNRKLGVRVLHECALYLNKYGSLFIL